MKQKLAGIIITFFTVLTLPGIITINIEKSKETPPVIKYETDDVVEAINISLKDNIKGTVQKMDIEEYIVGVVAAEMPASFESEALKAQAVAARTYAYRKKIKNVNTNKEDISADYNTGQAYLSKDELKKKWGEQYYQYYQKIKKAVTDTHKEIMLYEEEPIEAVFHSLSAGKTQSSEDVWNMEVPYLKSIESEKDTYSPDFISEKRLKDEQIKENLKSEVEGIILTEKNILEQIQIIARNQSGYIKQIQIANKIITGEEFRKILGLKSSNISITNEGDTIIIKTKGYGHGVGMSQYGANYMAKSGYTYKEILTHYYQGIKFGIMN